MKTFTFLVGLLLAGSSVANELVFTCENERYRLTIDPVSRTAEVTHKRRPGTTFAATRFEAKGTKVVRYTVHGEAKALRYEGTQFERWYNGSAVVRTSARLEGEEIVHSAEFLIDYDPYYTVTTWRRCVSGSEE